MLTKLIEFQKEYSANFGKFIQQASVKLSTKCTLEELATTKISILQNVMRGFSAEIEAKLLKRVDDILLELLKFDPKLASEDAEGPAPVDDAAAGEKNKEDQQQQYHYVSMLKLAIKSKMNATFDLGYPQREEFQNNILSWLPQEYSSKLKKPLPKILLQPHITKKAYKKAEHEYSQDEYKQLAEGLFFYAFNFSDTIYVKQVLTDIAQYMIDKNCMPTQYLNHPVDQIVFEQLLPGLLNVFLQYAKDNLELYVYFQKVCFIQLNLQVKDLRKNLICLATPFVKEGGKDAAANGGGASQDLDQGDFQSRLMMYQEQQEIEEAKVDDGDQNKHEEDAEVHAEGKDGGDEEDN